MSLRLVTGKSWFAFAAAAIAAAWLSACANSPNAQLPNFATGEFAFATATPTLRVYRLGPGDKLKITVFGEDNLSGQFDVNPSGSVSMALLGDVQAKGLTVQEFRDAVTQRLVREGILKNPKVAVDVFELPPDLRTRRGQERRRVSIQIRLAAARRGRHGRRLHLRAEQSYVLLGRDDQKELQVTMPGDAPVLPGDNIRIPERFF